MTDAFDLEQYRKERPMDFILAMNLINRSTNKNEIFQWIYQISRLHIPDLLYKYYSLNDDRHLNEEKLKTLRRRQIYLSDIDSLNDPFDSKAYFYRSEQLSKHEWLAQHGGRLIDDFAAYSKATSLTSNGINSMPMWAHYANNHKGYCISYDMKSKDNLKLSSCTFPVQYTQERLDVTDIMDAQASMLALEAEQQSAQGMKTINIHDLTLVFMISLLGNIKHTSWNYENEYRCSVGVIAEGPTYQDAIPKEVFIGQKCSNDYVQELVDIANNLNIPAYRMLLDENSTNYSFTPQRLN